MLAIARSKAEAERVTWVEGVLSDFESQQRFDLIFMTGHAFQCLLSDEENTDTFRAALRLLPLRAFLRLKRETRSAHLGRTGEKAAIRT